MQDELDLRAREPEVLEREPLLRRAVDDHAVDRALPAEKAEQQTLSHGPEPVRDHHVTASRPGELEQQRERQPGSLRVGDDDVVLVAARERAPGGGHSGNRAGPPGLPAFDELRSERVRELEPVAAGLRSRGDVLAASGASREEDRVSHRHRRPGIVRITGAAESLRHRRSAWR